LYTDLKEFVAYFKNADLSKKRLSNGWFHTGEIGQWNENGTLTIFGHKEEVLEPKEGKYAFARFLEFVYSRSEFVHQIFIYGKRLHPLVAIIVPDYEAVVKWAKDHRLKVSKLYITLCNNCSLIMSHVSCMPTNR
jgi:long-chain acyl-CoA synthetase